MAVEENGGDSVKRASLIADNLVIRTPNMSPSGFPAFGFGIGHRRFCDLWSDLEDWRDDKNPSEVFLLPSLQWFFNGLN